MPPTTPISAVQPQVNQTLAATGQMNLQQQQANNQAMQAKQAADLRQQQLDQQSVATQQALDQKTTEALLGTYNYQQLNQNKIQIAEMQQQGQNAALQENARQFNESNSLRERIHNENLDLAKATQKLNIKLSLAENYNDPTMLQELEDMEANLVEKTLRIEEAKKIAAGMQPDINKDRARATRAIQEHIDQVDMSVNRGMTSVAADFRTIPTGDFFETGIWTKIGNLFVQTADALTGTVLMDAGNLRDERIIESLANPDTARKVNTVYLGELLNKAMNAAIPGGNTNKAATTLQLLLSQTTPDNATEMAQQFQQVLQDEGIRPDVIGEMMRRMSSEVRERILELSQEVGVSPTASREDVTEEMVPALVQMKMLAGSDVFHNLAAAMPTTKPYKSWLATTQSPGSSLDELEILREQMGTDALGLSLDPLIGRLESFEAAGEDVTAAERAAALAEQDVTRGSRRLNVEQDAARRDEMLRILEESGL